MPVGENQPMRVLNWKRRAVPAQPVGHFSKRSFLGLALCFAFCLQKKGNFLVKKYKKAGFFFSFPGADFAYKCFLHFKCSKPKFKIIPPTNVFKTEFLDWRNFFFLFAWKYQFWYWTQRLSFGPFGVKPTMFTVASWTDISNKTNLMHTRKFFTAGLRKKVGANTSFT